MRSFQRDPIICDRASLERPYYMYTYIDSYIYIYIYIYIYVCACIYTYLCISKTLRVTAVSTGDGVIFEQGGNQGIGRNHQDPFGNNGFAALEVLQERPGRPLGVVKVLRNAIGSDNGDLRLLDSSASDGPSFGDLRFVVGGP